MARVHTHALAMPATLCAVCSCACTLLHWLSLSSLGTWLAGCALRSHHSTLEPLGAKKKLVWIRCHSALTRWNMVQGVHNEAAVETEREPNSSQNLNACLTKPAPQHPKVGISCICPNLQIRNFINGVPFERSFAKRVAGRAAHHTHRCDIIDDITCHVMRIISFSRGEAATL